MSGVHRADLSTIASPGLIDSTSSSATKPRNHIKKGVQFVLKSYPTKTTFRLAIFVFVYAFLAACSHTTPTGSQSNDRGACYFYPAHSRSSGEYVEGAYHCTGISVAHSSFTANSCALVDGYVRSDGTYVAGHTRCKYNTLRQGSSTSTPSSTSASCVTSYCGPVQVKGYTRKDGTYVRPHTRSSGKR